MNKIYILNGPPGSGKDTIAECLPHVQLEFKNTLHEIAIAISGMGKEEYYELYNNRAVKETPTEQLLGFSPRSFLIHISEVICKPQFGKDFFGRAAAKEIANVIDAVPVVFSDGGFPDEINVLSEVFGIYRVVIIHLHREGCSFEGDSRDYILEKDTGIKPVVVENNGTILECVEKVLKLSRT